VSAGKWAQLDLLSPDDPVPYSLTPKAEVELFVSAIEQDGDTE
jgi:hypothetical protein